jgi:hypothetical protein
MPNLQVSNLLDASAQVVTAGATASQLALSTNCIGVGTTAPRRVLHVVGAAPTDANAAQMEIGDDANRFLLLGRTTDYGFVQSHNNDPLAINPLGNEVGIGTDGSRRALHVVGGSPADANGAQLEVASRTGKFILIGRANDYGFVQSHNHDPLALNPLGNNVGVGTKDPQAMLDVAGSIRVADDVILTGADCAEDFEIEPSSQLEPGTVMVIDRGRRLPISTTSTSARSTATSRASPTGRC